MSSCIRCRVPDLQYVFGTNPTIFSAAAKQLALSYVKLLDSSIAPKDGDTVNRLTRRFVRTIRARSPSCCGIDPAAAKPRTRLTLVATGRPCPSLSTSPGPTNITNSNPPVVSSLFAAGHRRERQGNHPPAAAISAAAMRPFPIKQLKDADADPSASVRPDRHRHCLQLAGHAGDLRFSGPVVRRNFPRQDQDVERSGDRKTESRHETSCAPIQVIHRTEGKGSNYILSDFLCKVSPEFLAKAGRGESPKWPVGTSAGRSQDMADHVRATPGAIGYTELNLARSARRCAWLESRTAASEFVKPTRENHRRGRARSQDQPTIFASR